MNRVLLLSRIRPGLRLSLALLLALVLLASSFAATPATAQVLQESEQVGESGEADQSSALSQSGDSSNQCVGVQPVINTGNAQTIVDTIIWGPVEVIWPPARDQYGPRHHFFFFFFDVFDDFEAEEVGSSIDVSPTNTTDCTQEVNEAAAASSPKANIAYCWWGSDGWYYCYWPSWGTYYWDPYTSTYVPDTSYYTTVSNVAAGTLDAARGTLPLVTLGALALLGTASLLVRRNRGGDDD
jgi:hypothetical protein